VAVRTNVVDQVMNQAGISLANSTVFNNNPGSIAAHAGQALTNAGNIGKIAEQISEQSGASNHLAAGPQSGGGGLFMRTALTAGALAIGAIVAPVPAAVAAVVTSIGEAAHFGLKANVGKGEMTIAQVDAAAAFEKGVYVAACDGQSSSVSTGKPIASPMGQAATPAKGSHNFAAIVAEASAGRDQKEIYEDVFARFKQQEKAFAADMLRLEKMGAIDKNDPNAMKLKENMDDIGKVVAKLDAPKKALNVGMGSPSFG